MNGSTVSSVMEVSNLHHYQPSKGIYLLTNSTSTSSLNYQLLFSTCNHQEANLAAGLEASVMPHWISEKIQDWANPSLSVNPIFESVVWRVGRTHRNRIFDGLPPPSSLYYLYRRIEFEWPSSIRSSQSPTTPWTSQCWVCLGSSVHCKHSQPLAKHIPENLKPTTAQTINAWFLCARTASKCIWKNTSDHSSSQKSSQLRMREWSVSERFTNCLNCSTDSWAQWMDPSLLRRSVQKVLMDINVAIAKLGQIKTFMMQSIDAYFVSL